MEGETGGDANAAAAPAPAPAPASTPVPSVEAANQPPAEAAPPPATEKQAPQVSANAPAAVQPQAPRVSLSVDAKQEAAGEPAPPTEDRPRSSASARQKKSSGSLKVTEENLNAMRRKLVPVSTGHAYSITSLRGSAMPGSEKTTDRLRVQVIKYMNSYRLESKHPFRKESVYNIIRDVFQSEFSNATYEPVASAKACGTIASEIRARVKALGFDRYKLICIVQICEKNRQTVNSIAKFLWDPERDNCTSYSYESTNFLAAGAVFGLYYE